MIGDDFWHRERYYAGLFSGLMIGAIFFIWWCTFAYKGLSDACLFSWTVYLGVVLASKITHRRMMAQARSRIAGSAERLLASAMAQAQYDHEVLSGKPGARA